MSVRTFVHFRDPDNKSQVVNEGFTLDRLPHMGEFFVPRDRMDVQKVVMVIHCPMGGQYQAEVFTTPANYVQEYKRAGLMLDD